ncbi:MAG: hypothetical protein H6559_18055 [Lewinellaceae bacterium]|nr:hypothetical protein [Lewinellaceae bacterium]
MKLFYTILIIISGTALLAQPSDCDSKLSQAERLYEYGQFLEVQQLLAACLEAGELPASSRARAAFLLRNACNALGQFDKAQSIPYMDTMMIAEEKVEGRRDSANKFPALERYKSAQEVISLARADLEAHPKKAIAPLEALLDTTRLRPFQKIEALELLTEAHLQLGQPEQADSAFKKIFPGRPQYQPGSDRSLNYRQFARRYVSEPRYSFALAGGMHAMKPYSTAVYSPADVQISREKYRMLFNPHLDLQFYHMPLHGERRLKWEYVLQLGYSLDRYDYEGQYSNVAGPSGDRQEATMSFRERQRQLQVAGLVQFPLPNPLDILKKKPEIAPREEDRPLLYAITRAAPKPYIAFGIAGQRLDQAVMGQPGILYADDGARIGNDITLASRQRFFKELESEAGPAQRTEYAFSLLARLGLKYRPNRWFYFAEGGYAWTPVNMVAADARSANSTLVEDYSYLDNDVLRHHFGVTLGIGYSIYYTVKIR